MNVILPWFKKHDGRKPGELSVRCMVSLQLFKVLLISRLKIPSKYHDCTCDCTQHDQLEEIEYQIIFNKIDSRVKSQRNPDRTQAYLEMYGQTESSETHTQIHNDLGE
jgi:hypothetical protein